MSSRDRAIVHMRARANKVTRNDTLNVLLPHDNVSHIVIDIRSVG